MKGDDAPGYIVYLMLGLLLVAVYLGAMISMHPDSMGRGGLWSGLFKTIINIFKVTSV